MSFYGIQGVANLWLQSYLDKREQFCSYNGTKSDLGYITCGVPHGVHTRIPAVKIYINGLGLIATNIILTMFADDSNLFLSGKNTTVLENEVNIALQKFTYWLVANRPEAVGSDRSRFLLLSRAGERLDLGVTSKNELARHVWDAIEGALKRTEAGN